MYRTLAATVRISIARDGEGSQVVSKFEQVSNDGHQMSPVGGEAGAGAGVTPCTVWSHFWGRGLGVWGPSTVMSNASWVMVMAPREQTDRHE